MTLEGTLHRPRRPMIFMGDERISTVDKAKYLGVIIDEAMSFDSHILDIVERVKKPSSV